MAYVRVYRSYRFLDKDPVIDQVRTIVQDEGLMKRLKDVSTLSGVSKSTLDNWFAGETKKPQHASIMAVATALGYEYKFTKGRKLDVEAELPFAIAWLKKEREKAERANAAKPKKRKRRAS